jgi:hypothetical protein
MNIIKLVLPGAVLAFSLPAEAQQSTTPLNNQTSPPAGIEPITASFVPVVESKCQALEVVSVTRRDPFVRIRLKNVSDKNIYAFRMRYHKGGAAILLSYVMSDTKAMLAPGEVYRYDWSFSPNSSLARESLIFEAVIFQDGTGDGEADKAKSLQDLFLTNMKELEHEIALLQAALDSSDAETLEGLRDLQTKVSETPESMSVAMLNGLVGITLPSWKGTTMGMIREIERKKRDESNISIREELLKLKESYTKSLAKYPGTIQQIKDCCNK